jgi:Holliday junction resolvase
MKDNDSIRTFGECLNKMQKPGKGADLSEVPDVLTYAGKIRIALRVRTRQKQKLLRD